MGSYGPAWARIKTGESHMHQDHFQTHLRLLFHDGPDLYNSIAETVEWLNGDWVKVPGWEMAAISPRILRSKAGNKKIFPS